MMKTTLRGRLYDIIYMKAPPEFDGECGEIKPEIFINRVLGDRPRLEAELHEMLHACMPDLNEEAIDDTARDISKFLWRRGYRMKGK